MDGDLLRILDNELRLVTPTDPEGTPGTGNPDPPAPAVAQPVNDARAPDAFYQLTHDYLVPALRAWLTRKHKESRRGRAELRLAERAVAWNAKPEKRHLPAWWEWASIRLVTKKNAWTISTIAKKGDVGVFSSVAIDPATNKPTVAFTGADGLRDFTASINGGPAFLFLDVPALTVNTLGGSDTVTVQAPAPNLADWNVSVTVNGQSTAVAADGTFQITLALTGASPATITAAATDLAGNSNSATVHVATVPPPVLTLSSPAAGSLVKTRTVSALAPGRYVETTIVG